ncbi:MAG TPA: 2Fe-2S iron-sulfur cluster-binding protein [Kofleriaceae bacterium]|nr:2Fe-2S iron-sulfur cluster-binding protein [Kofleriaceae bacterium]
MGTPIAVGMVAPSFVLHGDGRPPLSSSESRGRPWVLAFARRWAPGIDTDAIRAQLRGLGAILFVVSDAGVWSFRPDDDVELSAAPSPRLRRELAELGARCGVDDDEDGVLVVDGDGIVRFAQAPCDELSASLASALDAAGRELLGLPPRSGITRRDWAVMSLVAGFALVLFAGCRGRGAERPGQAAPPAEAGAEIDVVLRINGQDRRLRIDPRVSLLDALREHLALTGARKGCDHGQCGACTVLRDGHAVNACLTLAVAAEGAEITTIEGLARGDQLHPLQAAFIAHDAFQCGYCTSGQILAAVALLRDGRARSNDEVRQQMSGNICRCGAYPNIIAAIQAARKEV